MFLDRTVCYCSTMNRIDLPHLVWALEELVAGRVVNQITVDPDTAHYARVALDQMLALPVATSRPSTYPYAAGRRSVPAVVRDFVPTHRRL